MQKWIKLLSGLLTVQLVLALAVNLSSEEHGAFQAKQKLLAFDAQAVNGLRIEADGNSLLLQMQDGRWLLPESGGFPADKPSVQRLLDNMAGLEQGWPVATTGSALRRFKVADDEFQTRITLLKDDQSLAQLYVGTSPGFRRVHVRPADAEAVFAVNFNSWEASAKADDWLDKEILKLDQSAVERLELPGVVLQRKADRLQVTGLSDQEKTNQEAVAGLLDKLTGLRIQSLLGREAKPEYRQDAPALELKLTRQGGEVLSYRFSKPQEGAYYVLKRSDYDDYFKIPEFSVKPLLETHREKLVQSDAKESQDDTTAEEQHTVTPLETTEPTK
jgi:hypothetical protein